MVCKICGANNPDGAQFCDDCGAPLIEYNQQVQQQAVQSQMQQSQMQQLEQQRRQQQQRQQQMENQLSQQQQKQLQNGHVTPQNQIQYRQQPNQMQQPVQSQYVSGQSIQQQPLQSQYTPQQPLQSQYTPQQQMQQQPIYSDKVKKGKSKGLLIFFIVLLLLAALTAVFIIFVLPKLSKGEPKGEYKNSDFGGYILFDEGVYAVYDNDGGYELGTYEIKNDEIIFTNVNGEVDHGRYNKKDNTVEYGYTFESNGEKETFDVDIDKDYVKSLKDNIKKAADTVCGDSDVISEAEELGAPYYIYGNELSEGHTAFTRALADKLGYGNDRVLSYLLENNYITIDISVNTSSKTTEVTFY